MAIKLASGKWTYGQLQMESTIVFYGLDSQMYIHCLLMLKCPVYSPAFNTLQFDSALIAPPSCPKWP